MRKTYAWSVLEIAQQDGYSSIRIYLNTRRRWVRDGDEDALESMIRTVPYLNSREYDAVKALGDVL